METNFLSGSENLYKYLVSVGLLLVVLTVFYPLKEKQEIQIETICLEKDLAVLNHKIKDNYSRVQSLKKDSTNRNIEIIKVIEKLNFENHISQIKAENKRTEINERNIHISLYDKLFWIFFPIGVILIVFGFFKWLNSKKTDDAILSLEKQIKELEVKKLKNEIEEKNKHSKMYVRNNGENEKTIGKQKTEVRSKPKS